MTQIMSKHIIREQRRIENKRRVVLLVFAIACLVGLVLDVMTGPSMLPVRDVIEALLRLSGVEDTTHTIIYDLRLPIALMALLVGASLGAGGAEMQTLLNNPMASPYTLGLAAAAGFGASLVIAFGGFGLPLQYAVPIGAFAMTMLASAVLFLFASLKQFAAATLILVGIALLFIFQSLLSLVQFIASPEVSQQILFWLFGNLDQPCRGCCGQYGVYYLTYARWLAINRATSGRRKSSGPWCQLNKAADQNPYFGGYDDRNGD